MDDEARVRTVAFQITTRFEGSGYHSFQNYDAGIISYGRFQFTLASGALGRIVSDYLRQANTNTATALQAYATRIQQRDESLRHDSRLRDLLIAAAQEPIMQQLQDDEATRSYWEPIKRIAIAPRGLETPLAWALLFDVGINFGVGDGFLRIAEREFGVPARSNVHTSGLSEVRLITRVAELRKISHDRQAERDNLPGLRVRGDFWVNLVYRGDWQLQGDANGQIIVNGTPIQVRAPGTQPEPSVNGSGGLLITPTADRIRIRTQPVNGTPIEMMRLGTQAEVLEPVEEARSKVGVSDEWLYIRTPGGIEGYTAAWFYTVVQQPAPAPETEPVLLVAAIEDHVRIRRSPVSGTPVSFAQAGMVVEVLEPPEQALAKIGVEDQWLHIRTSDGLEGYTAAWFYQVYDPYAPLPEPEPVPPPTERTLLITPTDGRIRVRYAPVDGEPIGFINVGQVVEVLEPDEQVRAKIGVEGQWLHIRTSDGLEGYTAAWYYRIYDPDAPVPEPEPVPLPTPEPEPEPEWPEESLLITPTEDGIRVRTAPVNGEPVGIINMGQVVEVLEPYERARAKLGVEGQWLLIRIAEGVDGFVAAWYFQVYDPDAPVLEPEPPPPPPDAVLMVTPTTDRVRVREQPIDGEPVGLASRGDVLIVLEPAATARNKIGVRGDWLHVRTSGGIDGYTAAWFYEVFTGDLPDWRIEANLTGVNLDLYHPLGNPPPERLGEIGWVRLVYNVSLDPEKPVGDPQRYGNTDLEATYHFYQPRLQAYAQAGLKVILVLNQQTYGEGAGYNWLSMDRQRWRTVSDRFVEMAGQIATQYRGQGIVQTYQIWNEMDAYHDAQSSVPMPAQDYAYLLEKSIRTIRAADPNVLVITGGHTTGPISGVAYARRTLETMPDNVRPDGLALHPYGRGDARSEERFRPMGHIDDSVNAFASLMPGTPVWITEWGILNQPDESPAAIAQYAREFITRLKSLHAHKVATACWFAWGQGMDNGYGIVGTGGQKRNPLTDEYTQL
jgi:hypothetical protein